MLIYRDTPSLWHKKHSRRYKGRGFTFQCWVAKPTYVDIYVVTALHCRLFFVNFKLKFQMFARFCLYDNKSDSNGMYQQSSLLRSIIVMTIFLINSP